MSNSESSRSCGKDNDEECIGEEVGVLRFPKAVGEIGVDGHAPPPKEDLVGCDSRSNAALEVRDVVASHVHPGGVIILRRRVEGSGWDVLRVRIDWRDVVRLAPVLRSETKRTSI